MSYESLAQIFDDFDFNVDSDDFFLYEIARLIEDDRASFEDEEFRAIIDEGIRAHIEEQPEIRTALTQRLRAATGLADDVKRLAHKTTRTLENKEAPLHNVSLIVHAYTTYMFRRLEETPDAADLENQAHTTIERWNRGEVLREQMTKRLKEIGGPAVAPLADLLFDAPEDRASAEVAIEVLATIRTSASARVLAHAVFEPILPEELEMKAYAAVRSLWPLPRHYILYTLRPHTHEDLSFRWFQLLVETNEPMGADMILDEVLEHSPDPAFQEDLKTIIELLRLSRDPEVEQKIVALLNAPETPREAIELLESFIANFRRSS